MQVTLLTTATRGDTAPFAALALGLRAAGHQVRLAGGRAFASTARSLGLDYFALDTALIARSQTAAGLEQLQAETWQASQGTDAIVYDPLTLLNGYFLARQMGVPAVAAALAPLHPTRAHPAWPFYSGPRLGAAYNRLTHTVWQQAAWQSVRAPVQKFWRQRAGQPLAGLGGPFAQQHAEEFTVLYGYSRHVLPRPDDWPAHLHVTGYWFLDPPDGWRPPASLLAFLRAGPPPVYVGVRGPATALALEALRLAGLRGVLPTGEDDPCAEQALPESVIRVDNVPHGWLFPRMAALMHDGSAALTAAGLRAGVPAVVVPPGGWQDAWGRLLEARGLGPAPLARAALTAPKLAAALEAVLTDRRLRDRVAEAGDCIESDGVAHAVRIFDEVAR